MSIARVLPKWIRDLRRRNRDTLDIEKSLREHSETLRGLTVKLQSEIDLVRGDVPVP